MPNMSSYNHTCLAGLDTIISLHFENTPPHASPTAPLDGVPYVHIQTRRQEDVNGWTSRYPLGDKTSEMNLKPSDLTAKSIRALSIHTDPYVLDQPQNLKLRPKPCRLSTSFQPLPPVPSASSLQLPSFKDFSFHVDAQTGTSFPRETIRQSTSKERTSGHPYQILAFQHPNSPYVPWDSPVRREILRPLTPASRTSLYSSCYSPPYSRNGARAPEPLECHVRQSNGGVLKVSQSWRNLRFVVKKNVKHVAKRITNLTKPSKQISATNSSKGPLREYIKVGCDQTYSSRISTSPRLRNSSVASLVSSDTNTLAAWLFTRQHEVVDGDNGISLEDYERMGSWLNVSRLKGNPNSMCGVPDCPMHTSRQLASHSSNRHWTTSAEQYAIALQSPSPRNSLSPMSPTPPQSRLLPQVSSRIAWFDSLNPGSRGEILAEEVIGVVKLREMSMPGGWTFSS